MPREGLELNVPQMTLGRASLLALGPDGPQDLVGTPERFARTSTALGPDIARDVREAYQGKTLIAVAVPAFDKTAPTSLALADVQLKVDAVSFLADLVYNSGLKIRVDLLQTHWPRSMETVVTFHQANNEWGVR